MTKYVVSGYIGFDNFGDEAIAKILTSHLKQNGEVTVISSNPAKTAKLYGVKAVGMLDFIKPILESDVLVSGGGSLLQDVTSLKSLLYYLAIIMTALAAGKKVVIFAQGFTPFRTNIGKFLTKFALKHCHKITVRDIGSQKLLADLGINSELVADPVFGITVPQNITHQGVGVQLRSFNGLTDEFLKELAKEIKQRFPNEEIKLISLQDSLDVEVLKKFSSYGLQAKLLSGLTADEIINEVSNLEYLVGMRFHSSLVAAKAGVKVLGIDYDIKVKKLASDIGFPLIEMNGSNISEGFDKLLNLNTKEYTIPEFIFPQI